MSKKSSIIIINGRHYDAETGEALSAASRHLARHATRHMPKSSQTLMRQTVKKPQPALKRRIKVQGHLGHVHEHKAEVAPHALHGHFERKPRHYQPKQGEGRLISHFSPDLFTVVGHVEQQQATPAPEPRHRAATHTSVAPHPRKRLTTAELLEYAVEHAQVPQAPQAPHDTPSRKTHRKLLKRPRHSVAV